MVVGDEPVTVWERNMNAKTIGAGEDEAARTKENAIEKRLSELENHIWQETCQRIRANHDFGHRIAYLEHHCLTPVLRRKIAGPIPWLRRLLGLGWQPHRPASGQQQ